MKARVDVINRRERGRVLHPLMLGFFVLAVILATGWLLGWNAAGQPFDAAPVVELDAAPAPAPTPAEAGSGVGTTPAPHESIDDPTKAPAEYIDDVRAAKRQGWPLAILVGVYGVLLGLIRLGWVKKLSGTAAAVVAGAGAVLASAIDALMLGGTWWAAVFAGAGALLLLFTPAKTKAKG